MASFARIYQRSFESHPAATLALAGGSLTAFGDMVAQATQLVFAKRNHDPPIPYDPRRTLRFFVFGFGMSPIIGRWNLVLERRFPLRRPGSSPNTPVQFTALAKRVAADQLVMAPAGLMLFIGTMGIMEGQDRHRIAQKYRDMFKPALVTNWQVWPLIQFVNFRFMPLAYRVPFQQTCGVFWTLYLSMLNSSEDKKEDYREALNQTAESKYPLKSPQPQLEVIS